METAKSDAPIRDRRFANLKRLKRSAMAHHYKNEIYEAALRWILKILYVPLSLCTLYLAKSSVIVRILCIP